MRCDGPSVEVQVVIPLIPRLSIPHLEYKAYFKAPGKAKGENKGKKAHSHPGVLALGYVKITTPAVLFSSNSFTVTLAPSCVCTCPPKLARSPIVPPSLSFSFFLLVALLPFVAGADAGATAVSVLVARGLDSTGFEVEFGPPVTAALALSASFLILELCCVSGDVGTALVV